jgi:hypothetical protein
MYSDVAELVGFQPISAAEFHERYRCRVGLKVVARHRGEAFKQGIIDRQWEGNRRFGHYVYFQRDDEAEGGAK